MHAGLFAGIKKKKMFKLHFIFCVFKMILQHIRYSNRVKFHSHSEFQITMHKFDTEERKIMQILRAQKYVLMKKNKQAITSGEESEKFISTSYCPNNYSLRGSCLLVSLYFYSLVDRSNSPLNQSARRERLPD